MYNGIPMEIAWDLLILDVVFPRKLWWIHHQIISNAMGQN